MASSSTSLPTEETDDLEASLDTEEDEYFEDFTNATEWEQFISDLERILGEWQNITNEQEHLVQNWVVLSEKVNFAEWPFKFTYFRKQKAAGLQTSTSMTESTLSESTFDASTSKSTEDDGYLLPPYLKNAIILSTSEFPPKFSPHPLAEYYNLEEFAVISSAALKPIENESKLKMLLSSALMAINNTNTNFPIHVQFHDWRQNYFSGIAESCGLRTDFHMIHLKYLSRKYWYLTGLLELFKSKIGRMSSSVEVTVHVFYTMKQWHHIYTFDTELFDVIDYLLAKNCLQPSESMPSSESPGYWNDHYSFLNFIPFGPVDDPFENLVLIAGWPGLSEDVVIDGPDYSDLEPESASEFYFCLNINNQIDFRLEELLKSLWKLRKDTRSVEDVLGKKLDFNNDDQYMSALDRIASGSSLLPKPVADFNRVLTNVNRRVKKQLLFSPSQYLDLAPLPQTDLDPILGYLFPDSLRNPRYPYPSTFDKILPFEKESLKQHLESLRGIKTVPVGSLIWRIGTIIAYLVTVNASSGVIAHIWAELVLELRYRFENSILIIGNMSSYDQLITGNQSLLRESRFNMTLPVILLIHGFKNNHTTDFARTLNKAYLTAEFPANIINVNWKGAKPSVANFSTDLFYAMAVSNIPAASIKIVNFLNFLLEEKAIIGPDKIHIVGFSLGAHVAGVTGFKFYNETNKKIERITGLDPAGPLFTLSNSVDKLDKSDANFVDVIHTNKGMKGISELSGHVDFFPNGGGPNQPGCTNITYFTDIFTGTCSHARAYKYFAKSILDNSIIACKKSKSSSFSKGGQLLLNNRRKKECLEPVIFGQYCPATLESGPPNISSCLLNQKFQMLNACIEKKIFRETQERAPKPEQEVPEDEEESDEDEFFDCDDSLNIDDIKKLQKPAGRLKKNGRLRLLKTGEPMYIPITQDPAPLTEDVVDEHLKMMVDLGDDEEGSELRAKMQSASLTSDMQAFKAANPCATLEDFVRWHSPRDWIEGEETDEFGNKIGELSPRMEAPGNLWQEVWSNTQPVPCRRQKRLFDDTKEAEKVLKWMTTKSIQEIIELLFPCMTHISLLKIFDEIEKLPVTYEFPLQITQQFSQLTRTLKYEDYIDENAFTNIISSIGLAERHLSQFHSFMQKFPSIDLNDVLADEEEQKFQKRKIKKYIKIEDGLHSEIGIKIKDIFCKEIAINRLVEEDERTFKFTDPTKRVFVLKYMPKKTKPFEKLIPQRMSCCLRKDEFLAAYTFTTGVDIF